MAPGLKAAVRSGSPARPTSCSSPTGDPCVLQSIYNAAELGTPLGPCSQVARVKANELLLIAGMVAVDADGQWVGDGDFQAQASQVFDNIHAALRSAGAHAHCRRRLDPLVARRPRHGGSQRPGERRAQSVDRP